ncbi:MAG: hypothetical protein WC663_01175 [Patescibacteria group bacterium]|jgi:hypothetical protein
MPSSPEQYPQLADIKESGEVKKAPGFELEKSKELDQFAAEANKIAEAIKEDKPVLLEQVLELREALEKMVESDPRIEAKRLFGEGYMGPEEIEKHFTLENGEKLFEYTSEEKQKIVRMLREKLDDPQIRDLIKRTPKEELRERFQLFLFPDKFKDGTPVTMKSLYERFQPEMTRRGLGELFHGKIDDNDCWYYNKENKEPFFTSDSNPLSWKLLSRGNLKGSENHDYFEETKFLREYLRQNNLATEDELNECSDERLVELRQLNERDWKKAAKQLSEIMINKNYRINPLEAVFMHSIKESVLMSARTAKCSSSGGYIYVGFYGHGIGIGQSWNGNDLTRGISNLGVALSC